MAILVIVGCGKAKLTQSAPAQDLYTGCLFRACRRWAEDHGDYWLIASAKYGLVEPTRTIAPYDKKMPTGHDYRRAWGGRAQADLAGWLGRHPEFLSRPSPNSYQRIVDLRFIALAGRAYAEPLRQWTAAGRLLEEPLRGLAIGQRLAWLATSSPSGGVDDQLELAFNSGSNLARRNDGEVNRG